jgi:hypothetical protein
MADVRSALDEAAIVIHLQKSKPKKTKTTTTSTLIPPHIPKELDLKWKKRRQK